MILALNITCHSLSSSEPVTLHPPRLHPNPYLEKRHGLWSDVKISRFDVVEHHNVIQYPLNAYGGFLHVVRHLWVIYEHLDEE